VRDFLDYLQEKYFNAPGGCDDIATAFSIGQRRGYTWDMLNCLGTTPTYMHRMTLFPLHENGIKYKVSPVSHPPFCLLFFRVLTASVQDFRPQRHQHRHPLRHHQQ
jgi:hypothetical protein